MKNYEKRDNINSIVTYGKILDYENKLVTLPIHILEINSKNEYNIYYEIITKELIPTKLKIEKPIKLNNPNLKDVYELLYELKNP